MTQPSPTSKTCTKCGETKPLDEYHRKSASPDGRLARCKACKKVESAARYAATVTDEKRAENAERMRARNAAMSDEKREARRQRNREYMRRRYAERRQEILDRQNANYAADPERFRAYGKAFREANPEKIADYNRQYREANAETLRAKKAAYHAANVESVTERSRRWRHANPEKVAERRQRRRAWIQGSQVGDVDLDALWTGVCGICGDPIDRELRWPEPLSKSLDHIIPLARGGGHVQDNLQWTHHVCNCRKGARLPDCA